MKEVILKIIREYSINAKNYDVTILREDLDNMSDDMVREITRHLNKEVSTQDPAIEVNPNPEGIDVWKELYERYKLTEGYTNDKEEATKIGDRDFMYRWIREKSGK